MNIKYPTVFAADAKIIPSDALMFSYNHKTPDIISKVQVQEKVVRGVIGNANDKEHDKSQANIQLIDFAQLNQDHDTLIVRYTCKFLPFDGTAFSCNESEFHNKLKEVVTNYKKTFGMGILAHRYAQNIANARSLFRNKIAAEDIKVTVKCKSKGEDKEFSFDAFDISESDFNYTNKDLDSLSEVIESAFNGEMVVLNVEISALMGRCQPVFPSQEMVVPTSNEVKGKSKILYSIEGQAAVHSQKIGNGIRTIDDFYLDFCTDKSYTKPISIEPYGSVTNYALVFRADKKHSFDGLIKNCICKGNILEDNEYHYVIATLIRGGVFGGK